MGNLRDCGSLKVAVQVKCEARQDSQHACDCTVYSEKKQVCSRRKQAHSRCFQGCPLARHANDNPALFDALAPCIQRQVASEPGRLCVATPLDLPTLKPVELMSKTTTLGLLRRVPLLLNNSRFTLQSNMHRLGLAAHMPRQPILEGGGRLTHGNLGRDTCRGGCCSNLKPGKGGRERGLGPLLGLYMAWIWDWLSPASLRLSAQPLARQPVAALPTPFPPRRSALPPPSTLRAPSKQTTSIVREERRRGVMTRSGARRQPGHVTVGEKSTWRRKGRRAQAPPSFSRAADGLPPLSALRTEVPSIVHGYQNSLVPPTRPRHRQLCKHQVLMRASSASQG